MTSKNELMLSVVVSVYNHEKYISEALDSILMQKINFNMEVLVGDDFSTDNTRDILRKYEKNYPGFFTMFYRDHNMFNEPITSTLDLTTRCKGKYAIYIEGDDFWTDEYKLQKQVDFLESHPEYIAVAHNCVVVGEDSKPINELYPECRDTEYTLEHYAIDILPGQTATFLHRNYVTQNLFDTSFLYLNIMPGDRRKIFTFASNGRTYCMQQTMSAYRHITSGGSSFSANYKYNYEQRRNWYFEQLKYAQKISNKDAIKCAEMLFLAEVFSGFRKHYISFSEFLNELKLIKYPISTWLFLIKRFIKRRSYSVSESKRLKKGKNKYV